MSKEQEFVGLLNNEMDSLVDDYAKRKIADLEAKLAESEREIEKCNDEWTEICDSKLETINRLIEEKHEFQQQLEDKEKHIIGQNALLNKSKETNKQLKQQLAEKDAEIDELKKGVYKVTLGTTPSNQIDLTENFYVIQNQTAIAELEKVKEKIDYEMAIREGDMCEQTEDLCVLVADFINQQIKLLKGDDNED